LEVTKDNSGRWDCLPFFWLKLIFVNAGKLQSWDWSVISKFTKPLLVVH